VRVVKHWNGLPRDIADAPFLEAFTARLDGALSNLAWLKMSLLTAGGLGYVTSKGRFQPKPFYDSVILLNCLDDLALHQTFLSVRRQKLRRT